MARYKIADFLVDITARHDLLPRICKDYLCEADGTADFTVSATDEDVRREADAVTAKQTDGLFESVAVYRKLCHQLPLHDAMMLHAAVVDAAGEGVAFLAKSGVGKSTHLRMWQQKLGDRLTVINGDKPIVRFFDGVPYAYGTPWAGKEGWHTNARTALRHLCFIERGTEDRVEEIPAAEALRRITSQLLMPIAEDEAVKQLEMLDTLLRHCRLWVIHCTPTPNAADVACTAILEEKE